MKFVSRITKLRVVVRPSRKEIKEVAGDQVVITHPAVICEFEGGFFDTHKTYPILQSRINCCDFHRLKDVAQLEFMLKASPEFGRLFSEYYEMSPTEMYQKKLAEAEDIRQQYNLSEEDAVAMMDSSPSAQQDESEDSEDTGGSTTLFGSEESQTEPEDEVKREVKQRIGLSEDFGQFRDRPKTVGEIGTEAPLGEERRNQARPLTYKQLSQKFKEKFGFLPMAATADQIINALQEN